PARRPPSPPTGAPRTGSRWRRAPDDSAPPAHPCASRPAAAARPSPAPGSWSKRNRERAPVRIPDPSLVLLVGASGSGKTTFARAHFRPTEILSSDAFRAMVADHERDQSATPAAFELLHLAVSHRLRRRRLTVVDA